MILTSGPDVDADVSEFNRVAEVTGGYPLGLTIAGHALAGANVSPAEFRARLPEMPRGAVNRTLAIMMGAYRLLPPVLQGTLLLLGTSFGAGASEALLAEVTEAPAESLRPALRQLVRRGFASSYTVYDQPAYRAHELVRHRQGVSRAWGQLTSCARGIWPGARYVKRRRARTTTSIITGWRRSSARCWRRRAMWRGTSAPTSLKNCAAADPSGADDFAVKRGFQND